MPRPSRELLSCSPEQAAEWYLDSAESALPSGRRALEFHEVLMHSDARDRLREFAEGALSELLLEPVRFRSDRVFRQWCRCSYRGKPAIDPREFIARSLAPDRSSGTPALFVDAWRRALTVGSAAYYNAVVAYVFSARYWDAARYAADPSLYDVESDSARIRVEIAPSVRALCATDEGKDRFSALLDRLGEATVGVAGDLRRALAGPRPRLNADRRPVTWAPRIEGRTWIEAYRHYMGSRVDWIDDYAIRRRASEGKIILDANPHAVLDALLLPELQDRSRSCTNHVVEVWSPWPTRDREIQIFQGIADEEELSLARYFTFPDRTEPPLSRPVTRRNCS